MVKKKTTELKPDHSTLNEATVLTEFEDDNGEKKMVNLSGTATIFEPSVVVKPLDDPAHDPVAVQAVNVLNEFVEWAKGGERDDITAFIQAGFLDETFFNLTETGVAVLEAEGVAWATTNFIMLGVPLTFTHGRDKHTLAAGSVVRVLHGGFDGSRSSDYWECYAGQEWPMVRVYRHRLHQFMQKPFPAAKPIS